MRRLLPSLILLGVLLLLGWFGVDSREDEPLRGPISPSLSVQMTDQGPDEQAPLPSVPESSEPNVTPETPASSPFYSEAQAFRVVMDASGTCALEAVEDLKGDFRKPRVMKRMAGMFACRLLDAGGDVLAEDTMQAPDQLCVVLDPQAPDSEGAPTPSRLTPEGPVVFQVRLPKVEGASVLEIVRLAGSREPTGNERPLGQLVASLDLMK